MQSTERTDVMSLAVAPVRPEVDELAVDLAAVLVQGRARAIESRRAMTDAREASEASEAREGARARPWARARAHALGAFVLYHLAAVVLGAIPDPGAGMNRSSWKDPTVQEEFKVWAATLSRVGPEVSAAALEGWLWGFAKGYMEWRTALARPFAAYAEVLGVRQPWRMFVAPHRFPTSLAVDLEEGGEWRTIYADRSREHTWREAIFANDRTRAAIFRYGWPRYRRTYEGFALWIAEAAARDFPAATRARVRMVRRRTPTPEEVRAGRIPRGENQQELIFELEGLR